MERLTAPYRMGLTATPWRSDGLHQYYPVILGEIVYWKHPRELQEEGYLARHREKRIYVELGREERERYRELMDKYREYCEKRVPWIRDPLKQFEAVLRLAARDAGAREALRARNEARRIALNAPAKIRVILDILERHRGDKVIIFSRYTDIVREVSRRLLVPLILHDTGREERKRYLSYFREGRIRVLATAMALDEGVDVPDASVAIVISGTGSSREYVQRLGRILRPKEKEAVLYEILTKGTLDVSLSKRRRRMGDVR
jgi:superfamily II DNA or RNA helicase